MSILKYVCLFCVFIGLVCSEESNVEEENVLVLNNSNFDQVINAHKYVLVKFCKFFIYFCCFFGCRFILHLRCSIL